MSKVSKRSSELFAPSPAAAPAGPGRWLSGDTLGSRFLLAFMGFLGAAAISWIASPQAVALPLAQAGEPALAQQGPGGIEVAGPAARAGAAPLTTTTTRLDLDRLGPAQFGDWEQTER